MCYKNKDSLHSTTKIILKRIDEIKLKLKKMTNI